MCNNIKQKKTLADYPKLMAQWDYDRNGDLRPEDFKHRSAVKVYWICSNKHSWKTTIGIRTNGAGCPFCAGKKIDNIIITHPYLIEEWDYEANGDLKPENITCGSQKRVGWKCSKGEDHRWKTSTAHRVEGTGCPFCAGKKISKTNNLAFTNPEIAKEWDYEMNGNLKPEDFTAGCGKKFGWKCESGEDHRWKTTITHRVEGNGCPFCAGKKISKTNNLAFTNPELLEEWDYEANGNLRPENFTAFSNRKIKWKCKKGEDHKWRTSISHRTIDKTTCPFCAKHKRKPSKNYNLLVVNPVLAEEWDYEVNGNLRPENFTPYAKQIVGWKCLKFKKHIWKASVSNRSKGKSCPHCKNSKGEKAIEKILKELNVKYFKQQRIPSCKSIRALPFDFIIRMPKNSNLAGFIEFHGKQHYESVNFGRRNLNPLNSLKEIQKRDRIKEQWCKNRNFPFLAIPYTEINRLEEILKEFLELN